VAGLPASVERVRSALADRGGHVDIRQFDKSTRTADDAAATIGCPVGAIAKSLVFRSGASAMPVLAIVSGTNKADVEKLALLAADLINGEAVERADADFVRSNTGYAIGGVPPVGHAGSLPTVIDEDLLAFATIWAAAGAPNAVFALKPQQLIDWTGGIVGNIALI